MTNIADISKPSVDRTLVQKKFKTKSVAQNAKLELTNTPLDPDSERKNKGGYDLSKKNPNPNPKPKPNAQSKSKYPQKNTETDIETQELIVKTQSYNKKGLKDLSVDLDYKA